MLANETSSITQCGRKISRQQLGEILETVGLFPNLSRQELTATICEHLEWVTVYWWQQIGCLHEAVGETGVQGFDTASGKAGAISTESIPKNRLL